MLYASLQYLTSISRLNFESLNFNLRTASYNTNVTHILGFVEPTLCITSMVQSYVVHHRPALCTIVHKGDLLFIQFRLIASTTVHAHLHRLFPLVRDWIYQCIHEAVLNFGKAGLKLCVTRWVPYLTQSVVALYWLGGAHDDLSCSLTATISTKWLSLQCGSQCWRNQSWMVHIVMLSV